WSAFVVAEVALTMVLLAGAGLLIRTVVLLSRVDPGFDAVHAVIARVPLGGARYESPRARGVFLNELARRVEALPGVAAAGAVHRRRDPRHQTGQSGRRRAGPGLRPIRRAVPLV